MLPCIVLVSDYGYPHNRERVILLGAQKCHKLPDVPKATHGECPGLLRRVTVKDVLGDLENKLPVPDSGLVELPDGRLVWNHCLNGSPSWKQTPVSIGRQQNRSYREKDQPHQALWLRWEATYHSRASAIASFPLEYLFSGDHKKICDQIGNAIPVNLANNIGRAIMNSYTDP